MFLPFFKFVIRPQTKFHGVAMCDSKVIRSEKVKFFIWSKCSVGQNFLQQNFFMFVYILIEVQQQILTCFCKFRWSPEMVFDFLRFLS